ncbi:MAG: hypothetical protein ACXACU_11545 [Candidatus Hodarchaeales archaeon]
MPEVSIPGMAFRARLSKKEGRNVVELVFRGDIMSNVDVGDNLTENAILSALKHACTETDIEHQIPPAILTKVAGDLFKEAGLGTGKTLVPQEFELGADSTELDRKLAIIITSLQKLNKKVEHIETMLELTKETQ